VADQSFLQRLYVKVRWYAIEFWAFVKTWFFWKSGLGILAVFIALFLMAMQCTHFYTRHGQSVKVPKIEDKSYSDALRIASRLGLDLQILDSVYRTDKGKRIVVKQDPSEGSRVKKGRTIYITITRSTADMVSLPDIKGRDDYDQYASIIKGKQINSRIIETRLDGRLEDNTIMAIMYQGKDVTREIQDMKIPRGSTLEFIVSKRTSEERDIPDLVCKLYSEASFEIHSAGLALGPVVKDFGVTDEANAYIYKQEPAPGSGATLKAGDQINLYLTAKKPESCEE
jgi:beta-lactam-binding protein with PASTA domain